MKKIITTMALFIMVTGFSQTTITKSSISSGGASVSNGTLSMVYSIGEIAVNETTVGNIHISEGFINATFSIQIDPKIFLQGPLLNPATAGLMNDNLRENGLIPTTSPYRDNSTIDASILTTTGNDAIVDWVWVELRAANDNTKIMYAKSALVQRDGDIVGLDGVSNLVMNVSPTNYYVVIKHHNHLGTMSSATIALSEDTATVVDFKNSGFSTFGTNAQVQLASGDMALWAGDANNDGRLNYLGSFSENPSIRTQVLSDPENSIFGGPPIPTYGSLGYYNTDVNMDGVTKYLGGSTDILHIRNNTFNNSSNSVFGGPPVPTFVFIQQLPEGANN